MCRELMGGAMMERDPILFVISGPSGSGKGTMISHVVENYPDIKKVVNYTTRERRPGERDGVHYNFVTKAQFLDLVADGGIFEYEKVYNDYYYGSPAGILSGCSDRVIELDYKGHRKYRRSFDNVVSIFLLPPSFDEMRERIEGRAREDNLPSRLENAREQMANAVEYDYVLLNDCLEECGRDVLAIVRAERARLRGETLCNRLPRE